MAYIAFVDETRQRMAASVGFERFDAPRDASFGRLLLARTDPLIVDDARGDARLALDPLVTGSAQAQLYAGAPLLVPGGHAIGCLAVADRAVRS
jgi:GAF domain-containing protein